MFYRSSLISFLPNILIQINRAIIQFETTHQYALLSKTILIDTNITVYDYLMLDEDLIGIFVRDVCGKGIPAALYMVRVLSDFHFYTFIR